MAAENVVQRTNAKKHHTRKKAVFPWVRLIWKLVGFMSKTYFCAKSFKNLSKPTIITFFIRDLQPKD